MDSSTPMRAEVRAPVRTPAEAFRVPLGLDVMTRIARGWDAPWLRLARLESALARARIEATPIRAPVWIAGLARSGSTILLELLARHPEVATQRYRDFPFVFVPHWWNRVIESSSRPEAVATERAHGDGIEIGPDSPEAFEEPLWMAFFEQLHATRESHVLDGNTSAPAFERFFADHLRKLLLTRRRTRYLAKSNYSVTRLGYLRRQFPDARFIVPVRDPLGYVASCTRQHERFCAGQRANPRARAQLRASGHFEFGIDRRPVNVIAGGSESSRLWAAGDEAGAWAYQWASVYGLVLDQLEADPKLARATTFVRQEQLRADPSVTVAKLLAHVGLEGLDPKVLARQVRPPSAPAGTVDRDAIRVQARGTAQRLGYEI